MNMKPKGPRGLPLIGNTIPFGKDSINFMRGVAREYGDVSTFKVLLDRWYLVNDPEIINEILVTQSDKFQKPEIMKRSMRDFTGNGVLSSEGEFRKKQGKLIMPGFHRKRLEGYAEIMIQNANKLIESTVENEKSFFDKKMQSVTLQVAVETLFGEDVSNDLDRVGAALAKINEVLPVLGRLPFAVPRWFPGKLNRDKSSTKKC